jgi:flavodoxin
MQVLVVYESRYGATQGIAEQIAATLRHQGLEATLQPAEHAGKPGGYDAAVTGSATYQSRWMKHATEFVRRNRTVLATRPVWLFSSGPLGPADKDAQGSRPALGHGAQRDRGVERDHQAQGPSGLLRRTGPKHAGVHGPASPETASQLRRCTSRGRLPRLGRGCGVGHQHRPGAESLCGRFELSERKPEPR